MIKIIKDGTRDKKYYGKCHKCATEFEFEHSDVKYEENSYSNSETKSIYCPVCGKRIFVSLMTKEEFDETNRVHGFGWDYPVFPPLIVK